MNPEKFRVPGQVGESKLTILDKQYAWGIYFWKKANGKPFTDGNGNVLNIPSHRGDAIQIHKLEQEAKALGQGDGTSDLTIGGGGRYRLATEREVGGVVDGLGRSLQNHQPPARSLGHRHDAFAVAGLTAFACRRPCEQFLCLFARSTHTGGAKRKKADAGRASKTKSRAVAA